MAAFTSERKLFVGICRRAFQLDMQRSTGGNISMRVAENRFLVKPSGFSLYDLTEADLPVCDPDGTVVAGDLRPTKELNSHLAVYRVRDDIGGIVHYHAPHATAFAVAERDIPLLTVHARRILGSIPMIPPEREGSTQLADAVARSFAGASTRAVILAGHGIMAAGKNLTQAQNMAELVEESAQIAFLHRAMGTEV